jgi:hypothetical protein
MDQNGLIVAVISEALEEDSPTQERYLECLDIDVQSVFMPCPSSQTVGYESCKESIEIEEEEEGPARG